MGNNLVISALIENIGHHLLAADVNSVKDYTDIGIKSNCM
jgi:hypothetical protein